MINTPHLPSQNAVNKAYTLSMILSANNLSEMLKMVQKRESVPLVELATKYPQAMCMAFHFCLIFPTHKFGEVGITQEAKVILDKIAGYKNSIDELTNAGLSKEESQLIIQEKHKDEINVAIKEAINIVFGVKPDEKKA